MSIEEVRETYHYGNYESNELREHRRELQAQIEAINLELMNRREDEKTAIKRKLDFVFQRAKEEGIAIEISTEENYMTFDPSMNQLPEIILT